MKPLAVASWLGMTIWVYTSSNDQPVVDIEPISVTTEMYTTTAIFPLAILYPNAPHYNACIADNDQQTTSSDHTFTSDHDQQTTPEIDQPDSTLNFPENQPATPENLPTM